MIKIIPNFLSNNQVQEILNRFSDIPSRDIIDNTYNFSGINLLPFKEEVFKIIPKLRNSTYSVLRLQRINKDIPVAESFHVDEFPFSFVIFLNTLQKEGLLQIENTTISPRKGTLVTIDGKTLHKVSQSYKDRWTLVGFLSQDLFQLSYSSNNKSIL